eukprot:bmy_20234T0
MDELSDIYMKMEPPYFLFAYLFMTRLILWILYLFTNMKPWNHLTIYSHSYSIHRLCLTLRTNIILRGNSYY